MASCSCGTHTGHFACVCPAGYYGRGLVGDCKRRLLYGYYLYQIRYEKDLTCLDKWSV